MFSDDSLIILDEKYKPLENKLNEIKILLNQNEQAAKLADQKKNDLLVYLAHDLKTPLTSVIGYLDLLKEIHDLPKKKQEKYLNITIEKAYRLETLINELFDITRYNSYEIVLAKEKVNLSFLLEQLQEEFYPLAKEQNKTITLTSPDDIILLADPSQLARVINNLIKNAISYSSDKSEIIVEMKDQTNEVVIFIINEGPTISKNQLDKVFDKFYRADQARSTKGGTGLGLAIAKDIVELHKGKIEVTSENNKTTFKVTLPKY